jgi:hypothetical protein
MGCIADTMTVIPLPKEPEAKEKNCSRCCEFPWLSTSCRLRSHELFNNECGREQALTVSRVWMRHDNIDIDCEACETDGEHKGRDVVELDRGRVVVEGKIDSAGLRDLLGRWAAVFLPEEAAARMFRA